MTPTDKDASFKPPHNNKVLQLLGLSSSTRLTWYDLRHTSIPGVRKAIKYGIEKDWLRSRGWVMISVLFVGFTIYNLTYYLDQFYGQRLTITKTYDFPRKILFPKIIMCSPTSYSFSRLDRNRSLIAEMLKPVKSHSLLQKMTKFTGSRQEVIEMLKLNLNHTMIKCTFQTIPCNVTYHQLHNYSAHACFIIERPETFQTNATGRDGGFELFLNLNAYDGIYERPGMPGGMKIIFVHPLHMSMPHHHDVVYAETGRLNSISLVTKKRMSINNCTAAKAMVTYGQIEMNTDQVRFYTKLPCLLHNYYTTKTSSKLRSQVAFAKLPSQLRSSLGRTIPRANELKSMFVTKIRERDLSLTTNMLKITKAMVDSFADWSTLKCKRQRHKINIKLTLPNIRGKANEMKLSMGQFLSQIEVNLARVQKQFITTGKKMFKAQFAKDAITAGFKRGSEVFELIKLTAIQFQTSLTVSNQEYETGHILIATLSNNAHIFQHVTDHMLKANAINYSNAHQNLLKRFRDLNNCFVANDEFLLKNVPFAHNQSMTCSDFHNTSINYGCCPDEIACPDFDNSYVDKYNMRSAYMRDSTPAPRKNIYSSIYLFCFLGVLVKDLIRAYSVDIQDAYVPWFELFRLNEISVVEWADDKVFDRFQIECRTFQACTRMVANVGSDGNQFSHEFQLGPYVKTQLAKLGMTTLSMMQSCQNHIHRSNIALESYLKAYQKSITEPFQKTISQLLRFRSFLPTVKQYTPPRQLYRLANNSLVQQFRTHLVNYMATHNFSSLAHFMNRRGKIMVGEIRIYTEQVQTFVTQNRRLFIEILIISHQLNEQLQHDTNEFLRILKRNVTKSILSHNISNAINIISSTKQCANIVLTTLETHGAATLNSLNTWLLNIQSLQTRAKQYEREEMLNDHFVKNNLIQIEIYYEDLAVAIDDEQYLYTTSSLVSKIGATCRFYMGLKIFNVAEFLGPIFLFLIYRVYVLVQRTLISKYSK